ncbi:TonB-dependent siderophore receptor [Methylobacterium organophilum]|uniref:TonB-dependent siderophore receptor n=1 Tax=Methylobacterium organophilum TaxID=410 RepID=UPI001F13CA1E|nr:TonB-dependent siderophore receptor [Methylobacterium organophilum]UMY18959.1 TonB-dependent siderophore receptor [Methylobacterium organophilum]
MPSCIRPAAPRPLATLLLLGTALTSPALAQQATTLETISVEGSRTQGTAQGSGNVAAPVDGSATSGGGGGPSGIVGYTARISPTATKTNTPLIEVPQSVSVVTREQLNDRNVQTLSEALAYTPGAAVNIAGYDPRFDSISIRGFDVTYNGIFRDGLRQVGANLTLPRIEPYGLESVTILRGPAAGLYGLGSPGGILDVTTKRPVFTQFGEMILQAGNYDRYQGNFDFGGPVQGSDGTLAYRLTGVVRQSDTFLPGAKDDRVNIAPAFTWKPSADTTFTFLSEYQTSTVPGTAFFYNDPGFRVSRFYSGDAAFNDVKQEQYRIGYAFEHKFTPDLIFRQNFRHYGTFVDFKYTSIDSINDARTIGTRSVGRLREALRQTTLDNQIEGHFNTGPIQHVAVAGLDYTHYSFGTRSGFGLAPDLDLVNLNYGRQFIASPLLGDTSRQVQDQIGVYLQDQMKFDRFILTLTGRHDWVNQDSLDATGARTGSQNDSAFTGRVGLGYVLAPGLVPYASYATTFTPQPGVNIVTNQPFKPATGDQIEAGVKYQIPGTNITAAVAGFDIRQSSLLRTDPTNVVNTVATGEVSSRGFEMEMIANFAPGTNLTLSYTHLNFQFVNQTAYDPNRGGYYSVDGNQLSGIPGDTFTAFATYLFPPSSPLAGLTIGGGTRFTTNSFADDFNTVRNPTVTLFDALVSYDFAAIDPSYKGWRAQINGYNILDRNYTNCQTGYCYRGAPATVIGSLIFRW